MATVPRTQVGVGRAAFGVGVSLLHTGEPALIDLIRDTIAARGPVPFRWFMEQALYHPQHGYYSSGRAAIGRYGDYFTNVSVGPLFGRIIAAQFEEMWDLLGQPGAFTIVEQGAHDGLFARDVLDAIRCHAPEFFSAVDYRVIEPFAILEDRQRETLREWESRVSWHKSMADLEPFCGVHFSNELIDAMPVHLVLATGSAEQPWAEKYVTDSGDGFVFTEGALSNGALADHVNRIGGRPAGYVTEVNLAALGWMEEVARKLERGFVLAVDYGYGRDEFYDPARTAGTLACYSQHRRFDSPLQDVGQIDITAHVEWTSVVERAEACGLTLAGFADQHHFMSAIATGSLESEFAGSAEMRRALQTLLHPGLLGMTFQFVALARNVPRPAALSGFRFARNSRERLGLAQESAEIVAAARRDAGDVT